MATDDALEPGTNALVLAPALSEDRDAQCRRLLAVAPPAGLDVLRVSYSKGAEEVCEEWLADNDELPARTGIVLVGDQASLTDSDSSLQLAVCFDSLTRTLQFSDVQSVFKFVHMFTGQLREVGSVGHFHIDPDAHDTRTVSRLKPAFDDAVRID